MKVKYTELLKDLEKENRRRKRIAADQVFGMEMHKGME
jgi:hypothetical protein